MPFTGRGARRLSRLAAVNAHSTFTTNPRIPMAVTNSGGMMGTTRVNPRLTPWRLGSCAVAIRRPIGKSFQTVVQPWPTIFRPAHDGVVCHYRPATPAGCAPQSGVPFPPGAPRFRNVGERALHRGQSPAASALTTLHSFCSQAGARAADTRGSPGPQWGLLWDNFVWRDQ